MEKKALLTKLGEIRNILVEGKIIYANNELLILMDKIDREILDEQRDKYKEEKKKWKRYYLF